jgi:hypothetical protein
MPSISTLSEPITDFPNRFVSPYGNDPLVPLYSSLPLFNGQPNCMPCAACGTLDTRNVIIQQQAERFKGYIPYSSETVEIQIGENNT